MTCQCCGKDFEKLDTHHIRSKGAGGKDETFNLIDVCRKCHTEIHSKGYFSMCSNNATLLIELNKRGWTLQKVLGRYKLTRF